jgi:hypothetical protein
MGCPERYIFPANDLLSTKLLGNSLPIPLAYNTLAVLATFLQLQLPHHDNMTKIILAAIPPTPAPHQMHLLTPHLDCAPSVP